MFIKLLRTILGHSQWPSLRGVWVALLCLASPLPTRTPPYEPTIHTRLRSGADAWLASVPSRTGGGGVLQPVVPRMLRFLCILMRVPST